ncbi:MAG: hypothetical protein Q8O72_08490 [Bacteroidales bacterium]|nr:hypothetical protein [Bacteroidales bacterium]
MKKSNLFLTVLLSMVVIIGCKKNDNTDEEFVDVTRHDNYLEIWPEQFSPAISYSWDGNYSITSGQPWSGVTSGASHGGLQLLVKAGRKGSDHVSNWFDSNVSNAACTINSISPLPYELNFAFTGTITINGNNYPVTIGQGHSGASNNWWIGGPGWVFPDKNNGGKICTPDRKYLFTEDGTSAYLFWISEK